MPATFDDILISAQPAIRAGRKAIEQEAVEGKDWLWKFQLADLARNPIDLGALGVTGECEVYDRPGMASVIVLDVIIDGATIEISATNTDTAGLAAGEKARRCAWRFTLTETATGRTCDVWSVRHSSLTILGDD